VRNGVAKAPERLTRILSVLDERLIAEIGAEDVAAFVVDLSRLKRETIRTTVATLAMVFDFHGITPNRRGTSGCDCRRRTSRGEPADPPARSPPFTSCCRAPIGGRSSRSSRAG